MASNGTIEEQLKALGVTGQETPVDLDDDLPSLAEAAEQLRNAAQGNTSKKTLSDIAGAESLDTLVASVSATSGEVSSKSSFLSSTSLSSKPDLSIPEKTPITSGMVVEKRISNTPLTQEEQTYYNANKSEIDEVEKETRGLKKAIAQTNTKNPSLARDLERQDSKEVKRAFSGDSFSDRDILILADYYNNGNTIDESVFSEEKRTLLNDGWLSKISGASERMKTIFEISGNVELSDGEKADYIIGKKIPVQISDYLSAKNDTTLERTIENMETIKNLSSSEKISARADLLSSTATIVPPDLSKISVDITSTSSEKTSRNASTPDDVVGKMVRGEELTPEEEEVRDNNSDYVEGKLHELANGYSASSAAPEKTQQPDSISPRGEMAEMVEKIASTEESLRAEALDSIRNARGADALLPQKATAEEESKTSGETLTATPPRAAVAGDLGLSLAQAAKLTGEPLPKTGDPSYDAYLEHLQSLPPETLKALQEATDAESSVASGDTAAASVEIPAAALKDVGTYLEELRKRRAEAAGDFGVDSNKAQKLTNELEAAERKERRVTDTATALVAAKARLEDPSLDDKERAKVEKQVALLEKISTHAEAKRQTQDRGFMERGLEWAKTNIAERWRTMNWKKKVGVGIGLAATASLAPAAIPLIAAAGLAMKTGSWYSLYQGFKARSLNTLGQKLQAAEQAGDTDALNKLFIERAIFEHKRLLQDWSAGDVTRLVLTGAAAFLIPAAIKESGLAESASSFIAEKFGAVTAEAAGGASVAEAAAASAAHTAEAAHDGIYDVVKGDNMYKILTSELKLGDVVQSDGARYNLIENILQDVRANPAQYGITSGNVDALQPGDHINIDALRAVLENKTVSGQHLVEHANSMHAVVADRLAEHMPAAAREGFTAAAQAKAEAVVTAGVSGGATNQTLTTSGGFIPNGPGQGYIPDTTGRTIPQALEEIPAEGSPNVTYTPDGGPAPVVTAEPVGATSAPTVTWEPIAYVSGELRTYDVTYANLRSVGLNNANAFMGGDGVNGDPIARRVSQFVANLVQTSRVQPLENENVLQYVARATAAPLTTNSTIA